MLAIPGITSPSLKPQTGARAPRPSAALGGAGAQRAAPSVPLQNSSFIKA